MGKIQNLKEVIVFNQLKYLFALLICLFLSSCNYEVNVQKAIDIFRYVKPVAEVVNHTIEDDEESYRDMKAENLEKLKKEIEEAEEIRKIEQELLEQIKTKEMENGDKS